MMEPSWIRDVFVDKANLMLKVINRQWPRTEQIVEGIVKILDEHDIKSGRVLDLCCGNGRFSVNLAKKGFEVTGVDMSEKFIEDARGKAKEHGVADLTTFVKGDVRNLDAILGKIKEPFDAVLSAWTSIGYYNPETDEKIFKHAKSLSRDKSFLLIAETAHQEHMSLARLFTRSSWSKLDDETIITELQTYDPKSSRVDTTWSFYKLEGENMIFLDRMKFDFCVYSLNEISSFLRRAGWDVISYYGSFSSLEQMTPLTGMNIVARRC